MNSKKIRFARRACLILALVAGLAEPSAADPSPRMGVFAIWARAADGADLGGREANIRDWEAWLGRAPSSLLAIDFYGGEDWRDLSEMAWLPGYWARRNPERQLVWTIPLTHRGAPLEDVAAGAHDADFAAAASAIAAAQPNAVIRLGWEMNGDWYAWASKGVEGDYVAAYRRAVGIFRAASPRFSFTWCVNFGLQASPPDRAYPGDDVVDAIGMDIYDTPTDPGADASFRARFVDIPFGLAWLERFAGAHGKPMAFPEWGVGLRGGLDNAGFVDAFAQWMADRASRIAYQAYFDAPPHQFESGRFPQARAAFARRFSLTP